MRTFKNDYKDLANTTVQPGIEAVELYLEAAKAAILQLAQDLEAQEAGFALPFRRLRRRKSMILGSVRMSPVRFRSMTR